MAKRKISVTVDEELLDLAAANGWPVSALVNAALVEHIDRLARRSALGELLRSWDEAPGPVDETERHDIRAAFAEADGVVGERASG